MKQLTKAEEEVMQILWELQEANVAGIIEKMSDPKPAYNTVSTIIRILETKEFVSHRKEGKGHIYFPLVPKETYTSQTMNRFVDGYFNGSFQNMVSFFMKKNKMNTRDLEEILREINKKEK